MSEKEEKIFSAINDLFGYSVSKFMFKIYISFVHDMKMLGLVLSLPFMFFKFWKEAYNKEYNKIKQEE